MKGTIHAVDLGGIEQALHVFVGAENRRAAGQLVAANAFKDRRAVVDDVRHHVDGRVVPVDELAVVPDLVGLLDCHAYSFEISLGNEAESFLRRGSEGKPKPRYRPL